MLQRSEKTYETNIWMSPKSVYENYARQGTNSVNRAPEYCNLKPWISLCRCGVWVSDYGTTVYMVYLGEFTRAHTSRLWFRLLWVEDVIKVLYLIWLIFSSDARTRKDWQADCFWDKCTHPRRARILKKCLRSENKNHYIVT